MRKVKFTQDTFEEKLTAILTEFPVLDVSAVECLFLLDSTAEYAIVGLASIPVLALECTV